MGRSPARSRKAAGIPLLLLLGTLAVPVAITDIGPHECKATFTSEPDGLTVAFDSDGSGKYLKATNQFEEGPTSYEWDFGDGHSSTEAHPTHTYLSEGEYDVELKIQCSSGSDSMTETVVLEAPEPPPTPACEAHFIYAVDGLTVAFNSTGSGADGEAPTGYSWDLGGIATSSQPAPKHTFEDEGSYTVRLTVFCGDEQDETEVIVLVNPSDAEASGTGSTATGPTDGGSTEDEGPDAPSGGDGSDESGDETAPGQSDAAPAGTGADPEDADSGRTWGTTEILAGIVAVVAVAAAALFIIHRRLQ